MQRPLVGTSVPDPWHFDKAPDPDLLSKGSGCGSCSIRQWLSLRQQKILFFWWLFLFEGTFTSIFKDKKSWKSHKTAEIKVFLHFLLVDGRMPIRKNTLRILIQEGKKHTDPTVLDPEHWCEALEWIDFSVFHENPYRPLRITVRYHGTTTVKNYCTVTRKRIANRKVATDLRIVPRL